MSDTTPITKGQVALLVRVSDFKDRFAVILQSASGAEDLLQSTDRALHRLPSMQQILLWSNALCTDFLSEHSQLWTELRPVFAAMSACVPQASQDLWNDLCSSSSNAFPDHDQDLWLLLRTHALADADFSMRLLCSLIGALHDICEALSPTWTQQGTPRLPPSHLQLPRCP